MQASDIMTAEVQTVRPDDRLGDAVDIMVDRRLSGLPVVDGRGALVGILTEGDLLRRIELQTEPHHSRWMEFLRGPSGSAADYIETRSRRVADIMTADVVSVGPDAPLEEVVRLLQKHRIKRVPVLADGKLVGLITRADLVRTLGQSLRAGQDGPSDDATIRARLSAELQGQDWFVPEQVKISVTAGVVTLDGVYTDGASHEALLVAARNVPGVRAVIDQLTFVSPAGNISV